MRQSFAVNMISECNFFLGTINSFCGFQNISYSTMRSELLSYLRTKFGSELLPTQKDSNVNRFCNVQQIYCYHGGIIMIGQRISIGKDSYFVRELFNWQSIGIGTI